MGTSRAFEAELLRGGARALASRGVELLLEREPACGVVWGEGSARRWQDLLARVVEDVAVAVDFDEPAIVESAVEWHREAFASRGAPMGHLDAALGGLVEGLRGELGAAGERGAAMLAGAQARAWAPGRGSLGLDASDPCGRLALRYLEAVLEGRRREASGLVVSAMDAGMPVTDIYERVLLPAERESGRMWHLGELTVGEEHFVSETVRSTMSVVCQRALVGAARGESVVVAAVQGDRHDIGARAAADLLELAGFRAIALGGDVPGEDLVRAAGDWGAGTVVLSVTMCLLLGNARDAVGALRRSRPGVRVIVGGAGFLGLETLAQQVGADGLARTASDAVRLAEGVG